MNSWYPDELFRYRGVSSNHFGEELNQLRNNKVWLNFLDTQNDPFEGFVSHSVVSYEEFALRNRELRGMLAERYPNYELLPETVSEEEFNACNIQSPLFHEAVRRQAVVASFSKGWRNTLMWGHYGEAFKGICLKFTASPKARAKDLPPFFPVQYWKEGPPQLSSFDFFAQMHLSAKVDEVEDGDARDFIQNIAHEKTKIAATSKSFDWAYEEEFRMASFWGVPGYFQVPGMKLTGVIFGPRAEAPTFHKVMDALGDGINYFKMTLQGNSYSYQLLRIFAPENQA